MRGMLKKLLKILTSKNPQDDFTCYLHETSNEPLYINSIDTCYQCFSPLYKSHRKCILELKKFFITYP
jgi:hypothetical protein